MANRAQSLLVFIALVLLVLGCSIYLFDRPAERVYFLPDDWNSITANGASFGVIGRHFPGFAHVVAFILISGALLAPWRIKNAWICLSWLAADGLFELGQHDWVSIRIAATLPAWFDDVVVLENSANYFLNGTFDMLDMLSIAIGALFAYFLLNRFRRPESKYECEY